MERPEAHPPKNGIVASMLSQREALSPYKANVWRQLTPAQRLWKSWELRSRMPPLKAVHDRKSFPKP
jgi:hypothetical protein